MEMIFSLLGTEFGKAVAFGLAAIAAFFGVVLKSRADGRAQERAKQDKASLDALRERTATDDTIQNVPADERRKRLAGWVPDDKR